MLRYHVGIYFVFSSLTNFKRRQYAVIQQYKTLYDGDPSVTLTKWCVRVAHCQNNRTAEVTWMASRSQKEGLDFCAPPRPGRLCMPEPRGKASSAS